MSLPANSASALPRKQSDRLRVAFVVQRCGHEVTGGAETLCLKVAKRMAVYWETTILTTCALDYIRWENHYPKGRELVGPTSIERFPVDEPRDLAAFDSFSAILRARGAKASLEEQEQWMRLQGPMSRQLLAVISDNAHHYDAFIFFGYLYATTYFGLPLVRDKAWLAPLGHDEWPIYFKMWDQLFAMPRGLLFQTPEERLFLRKRFPQLQLGGPVTGVSVEMPLELDGQRFCRNYQIKDPFLLYLGRIDASKGCGDLFEMFCRLKAETSSPYRLVLIGAEILSVPFHEDIIYLGPVSEQEKWDAIAASDWLINPSPYESLSIVLLESWAGRRPVLVNARSEVMVGHCRRSNGGLWYASYPEFAAILEKTDAVTRKILGEQGHSYVNSAYSWSRVESCYLDAISPSVA